MPNFLKPSRFLLKLLDILCGSSIAATLRQLRKQQYLSSQELYEIQQDKLNQLFHLAKASVPYYKDYDCYEELPVLTKNVIRKSPLSFFSSYNKEKLIKKATGGSTGAPFDYFVTKKSFSYMWAGILLSWETAGYKPGDKVVFLAGSSLYKTSWKHRLFYKLLNIEIMPASPLNDDVMQRYAAQLKQSKATILYGYAYALNTMAEYLNKQPQESFPHLKGVVCTAELLSNSFRTNIEKAFGVKVYNQYGCNEAGVSAYECEQQRLHLISTRAYFETDENGTLLSTDLTNEAFVMMKYNTTDVVEMCEEACTCGRNFPVIKKLIGRLNDVVVDMEGQVLHASFFGMALSKDTSIQQYQVTFTNDTLNLNVHSKDFDEAYFYKKYIPVFQQYSHFKQYSISLNMPFEKTPNGKHREVVDRRKGRPVLYAV